MQIVLIKILNIMTYLYLYYAMFRLHNHLFQTIRSDTVKLLNDDAITGILKMLHLVNKKTAGKKSWGQKSILIKMTI